MFIYLVSNKCSWIFIFLILNYICLFVSLFSKFFVILLYLSILFLSMKSNCEFFVLFLRTFLFLCFLRFIMWILCIVLIYLLYVYSLLCILCQKKKRNTCTFKTFCSFFCALYQEKKTEINENWFSELFWRWRLIGR